MTTPTQTEYKNKHQDFVDWLEQAKWLLPPRMTIDEAHAMYNRKVREEEELKNGTKHS